MCYSAQIAASYREYLRMTGATMDLDQFLEIFGARADGRPIRIPRAVEHWFQSPSSPAELRIRDAIDTYRRSAMAQIETEIFAQRKRLADAERKLAVKFTRTASENRRIATARIAQLLTRLPLLRGFEPHPDDARVFPMTWVPLVMQVGGERRIRLARYHCRLPGKPAMTDRRFPGLYNARRDNLEGYWSPAFGRTHALMLAESFYENVQRDGRNVVLHFTPRPAATMLVACMYAEWSGPEGRLLSFAAITDVPPPEVAATGHDRMIVNLRAASLDAWLSPQGRSRAELHALLEDRERPYYEHEVLAA